MTRSIPRSLFGRLLLAVALVASAASAIVPPEVAGGEEDAPPASAVPLFRLFESVALLRWGHGALDWLLPNEGGEPK